jgi:hypothetical protein
MLTVDRLREASQYCVKIHNYYIQNYKTGQDIIVQFKDHHFLVGDDVSTCLNISLMCCFALQVLEN